MALSPLHSAIVLIEHKKYISKNDLEFLGSRSFRGVIGKMNAMNLVKNNADGTISLSKKGHMYINKILENVHSSPLKWDGLWTIVTFSIPEKNRGERDKFRRFIESIGIRQYFPSIWVSPLNVSPLINEYIARNKLINILLVRSNNIYGADNDKLISLWDFDKYRSKINNFIQNANTPIPADNDRTLEAKKRIFEYALILNDIPKFPIDLLPKDWPYLRAKMTYRRLRARIT